MSNHVGLILMLVPIIMVVTNFRDVVGQNSLGGLREANLNDFQTQQALQAGKADLTTKYPICNAALNVTKATIQVTKGNKYVFDFTVDYSPCGDGGSLTECSVTVYSFEGNYNATDPTCSN
ncbi:hypothetical protein CHUAL_013886 [Chamberlinius hualienensis]